MMLESLGLARPAARLMAALEATLAAGHSTPDVGGSSSTHEMVNAIATRVRA